MKARPLDIVTRHSDLTKYLYPTVDYKVTPYGVVTESLSVAREKFTGKSRNFVIIFPSLAAIAAYLASDGSGAVPAAEVSVYNVTPKTKGDAITVIDGVRFTMENTGKVEFVDWSEYNRSTSALASAPWPLTIYDVTNDPTTLSVTIDPVDETSDGPSVLFADFFVPEVPTFTPAQLIASICNGIERVRRSVNDAGEVQTPKMTESVVIFGNSDAQRIVVAETADADDVAAALRAGFAGEDEVLETTVEVVDPIVSESAPAVF